MVLTAVLGFALRAAWRFLARIRHFLDDFFGEPARPGVPERAGVMARLQSVEVKVNTVVAETKPNGGDSLRDVVHRTSRDVTAIKDAQKAMGKRMEQLEDQRRERAGGV